MKTSRPCWCRVDFARSESSGSDPDAGLRLTPGFLISTYVGRTTCRRLASRLCSFQPHGMRDYVNAYSNAVAHCIMMNPSPSFRLATSSHASAESLHHAASSLLMFVTSRHSALPLVIPFPAPAHAILHSSIVLMTSHPPSLTLSFHNVTLLSAPLTANTFPLKLQLTLHTKHSNVNVLHVQLPADAPASELVQIRTLRSCEADAM